MSIDLLQERIRKCKNPTLVTLELGAGDLPPHLLEEEGNAAAAYSRFCRELLNALKGLVPAVRVSFASFALLGCDGMTGLKQTLELARELGFYVVLDCPEMLSANMASVAAGQLMNGSDFPCNAVALSCYLGSDAVKPFLALCKEADKALFLVTRTANKTAAEIQDLLTGTRLVHMAVADIAARSGEKLLGKYNYSQVALITAANNPVSIRNLRAKYPRCFQLVEGLDATGGNGKNCGYAFDKYGRGAVVGCGSAVTLAWQQIQSDGRDFAEQAVGAAERIKKNLARNVSIL